MSTFNIIDGIQTRSKNETQIYKKIINLLMQKGKRSKAIHILYKTFRALKKNNNMDEKNTKNDRFVRTLISTKISKEPQLKYLGFCAFNKKLILPLPPKQTVKRDLLFPGNSWTVVDSNFFVFHKAIENVSPYLEVRKAPSKGTTRQIPTMIKLSRQQTLAIRWLINGALERKKRGNNFPECLALEVLEAFRKQGQARQKRNDLHKLAHSNRANLRYRWW
uniref:ribosomal protein S7 n=1 Tax=Tetraselmis marina TaxID=41888 RepID=UPI0021822368|nr:ribosomal protein S7 [Tetraselmis marina]UVF37898.1 ribosomal protein S7 [Tetraselmis marina]